MDRVIKLYTNLTLTKHLSCFLHIYTVSNTFCKDCHYVRGIKPRLGTACWLWSYSNSRRPFLFLVVYTVSLFLAVCGGLGEGEGRGGGGERGWVKRRIELPPPPGTPYSM